MDFKVSSKTPLLIIILLKLLAEIRAEQPWPYENRQDAALRIGSHSSSTGFTYVPEKGMHFYSHNGETRPYGPTSMSLEEPDNPYYSQQQQQQPHERVPIQQQHYLESKNRKCVISSSGSGHCGNNNYTGGVGGSIRRQTSAISTLGELGELAEISDLDALSSFNAQGNVKVKKMFICWINTKSIRFPLEVIIFIMRFSNSCIGIPTELGLDVWKKVGAQVMRYSDSTGILIDKVKNLGRLSRLLVMKRLFPYLNFYNLIG